jgi:DNA repair protein RadC
MPNQASEPKLPTVFAPAPIVYNDTQLAYWSGLARTTVQAEDKEWLLVLFLDQQDEIIRSLLIQEDRCPLRPDPLEIFREALALGAHGLITVRHHDHGWAWLSMSEEAVEQFETWCEVSQRSGIEWKDAIVLDNQGHSFSFRGRRRGRLAL